LKDLRIPPGNRLELFLENRRGQHSIPQSTISTAGCFTWSSARPQKAVEIVD